MINTQVVAIVLNGIYCCNAFRHGDFPVILSNTVHLCAGNFKHFAQHVDYGEIDVRRTGRSSAFCLSVSSVKHEDLANECSVADGFQLRMYNTSTV